MSEITEDNITLFASIFGGRQDIYAVRWEKNGESGYMPAYKVDWSDYQKHKAQNGTFSTGQYFGEGIDIKNLECLFIVYPFAFEGKLIQYIGRIQRSENPPVIFDYRDVRINYFENMFKQRNRYYKKLIK